MKQGLTQGNYKVSVFKVIWKAVKTVPLPEPGPPPGHGSPRTVEQPLGEREIERYVVPQRYADPDTSGLTVAVTAEAKDLNLELVTKP